jgi:peptidoglycan/LPS O-acetylase OafA/YrhL
MSDLHAADKRGVTVTAAPAAVAAAAGAGGSAARRPGRQLKGVDGLRALAALSVLTYHVALWAGLTRNGPLAPLFAELKAGVAVFFVISGTLLYLPFARAIRDRAPLPRLGAFACRRAARIVPAYWAALAVWALIAPRSGALGADGWRYWALGQIYSSRTLLGGLGVAWSLCVEGTFYAALPLAAAVLWRRARTAGDRGAARLQLTSLAAAALACVLMRLLAAGSPLAPIPSRAAILATALPGFLDYFAIGMALAVLVGEVEAGRWRPHWLVRLALRPGRCAALAAAAGLLALAFQHGDLLLSLYGVATHAATGIAAGLLVLAVVVPGASAGGGPLVQLLESPPAAFLGRVSYGVYLWHVQALVVLTGGSDPSIVHAGLPLTLAVWLVVVVAAILLGTLSHRLVELPAQRLARRLERSPPAQQRLAIPPRPATAPRRRLTRDRRRLPAPGSWPLS